MSDENNNNTNNTEFNSMFNTLDEKLKNEKENLSDMEYISENNESEQEKISIHELNKELKEKDDSESNINPDFEESEEEFEESENIENNTPYNIENKSKITSVDNNHIKDEITNNAASENVEPENVFDVPAEDKKDFVSENKSEINSEQTFNTPENNNNDEINEFGAPVIVTMDAVDENYNENNDNTVVDENAQFSTDSDVDNDVEIIEGDPDYSGEETAVDLNTEDTKDGDGFMSFDEANASAGDKKNKKNGVQQLNKKRIVYAVFGTVAALGLFMILKPESWTLAKKEDKNKPQAVEARMTDYESRATNSVIKTEPMDAPRPEFTDTGVNTKYTDNPAQTAYQDAYNQQKGTATGTGYVVDIPDTRNDRLQGKTISGIKGLTSTQETYATDYYLQKEKNSAEAAANTRVTGTSSLKANDPSDYVNQMLSSVNGNSYKTQNDQSGKQGFYNNGRGTGGNGLWLGLNTIWQGTIFDVILTSEINTDLPGEVTGRVSKNVYSSQDGRFLLIPQNSVLVGNYNSSISYAQSRAQVIWHTLIRPDGYQINLGAMNGTDTKGAAGLKGFVNDHPMAYVKAIVLMSAFSIINGEFQATQGQTNNQYVQNIAANSQEMVNKLGDKLIDRAMDVQPTIVIKAGTQINVVVNQNLTLPEYKKPEVTEPYHRNKKPQELN